MIKIFLLSITLAIALPVLGQGDGPMSYLPYERGYVFLKNGSVLKGKYIYSNNLDKIRVVSGKNTWIFDADEIDRVSKDGPVREVKPKVEFTPEIIPDSRFFNITEIGVLAGNEDNSQDAPLVVSSSMNYKFTDNLSAGAGLGIEFLKESYMPFTANLLYKLRNTRMTPFGMLQAGYMVPIEDSRTLYQNVMPSDIYYIWNPRVTNQEINAKGGFMANPSIGIMRQTHSGIAWTLSAGYRFHRLRYSAENDYRLDIDYNRLSVKLGIVIH